MTQAYILRFQEPCDASSRLESVGTMTHTRVQAEQPDNDPGAKGFSAMLAGTATKTSVGTEQPDNDRLCSRKSQMLAGTQTLTAVQAESLDRDRSSADDHRVLPHAANPNE